jgi:hypothetical protein
MELAQRSLRPRVRNLGLVTKRSSPTSWTLSPSFLVSLAQPSQSFSARPSSRERMGYLAHQPAQRSIISSLVAIFFLSLLKKL